MTYVISEEEKAAARREKKKLFWWWFAVLIVVLIIVAALITVDIYFVEVKRNRSFTFLFGALSTILFVGYACFTLFFFAIKYRLTRKYVAMLNNMDKGLKDTFNATFLGYDDTVESKDGVFFYTMHLKTRPLRRDDIDERKLLVEYNIPKINLVEGTKLKLTSHANILVAYEIISVPPVAEPSGEEVLNEANVNSNAENAEE